MFGKDKRNNDALTTWCKTCAREYFQQPWMKARTKARFKIWWLNLKTNALTKIGKLICKLCGDTDIHNLSIDHKNHDGNAHRLKLFGYRCGGTPFYNWALNASDSEIKKANLRILCKTCNRGTANNTDSQWLLTLKNKTSK